MIPAVVVAAVIAVANREPVTFSLDPFSTTEPAIAVSLPLYGLVFGTLLFGVLLGGTVVWLRRALKRRAPPRIAVEDQALDGGVGPARGEDGSTR